MKIDDIYQNTPVEKHKDIRVKGDRVYVRRGDGELWLFPSQLPELALEVRKMQLDLAEIKSEPV